MLFFLKPGTVFFILIGLLPIFVAFPSIMIAETERLSGILNLLGRAAGMLGLSLLLLATVQAVRIPGFDRWFGGLTKLWKVHHAFGAVAFLLLMLHPLLLAFAAAPVSLQAAAAILFPVLSNWAVWAGWLALLVMMSFLAPTFSFFGGSNYQRWKAMHAASGLTLLLALAHVLPLNRSLPGARGAIVWLALGSLSILAFIYRAFLARWVGRKPYKITDVKSLVPGAVELTLEPENHLLRYRPGQFVYLTPLAPELTFGWNEEHPYTLSSAPQESTLRIVIKDMGDATHALQNVSAGSHALIEGPYGEFFPPTNGKDRELWLAGGIGLAPFLSRARALASARKSADISLIYCVQDESRAYFLRELEELALRIPGFLVYPHYFYREGRLTVDFISARCPDFSTRHVYLGGPPPMIKSVRRDLVRHHVPPSQIRSEDFTWL